jgi:hypothetical protein
MPVLEPIFVDCCCTGANSCIKEEREPNIKTAPWQCDEEIIRQLDTWPSLHRPRICSKTLQPVTQPPAALADQELPADVREFRAKFARCPGEPLGFRVDAADDSVLQVSLVRAGCVEEYNKHMTADMQIKEGDFIIEVNGSRDGRVMLAHLQRTKLLDMRIQRAQPFSIVLESTTPSLMQCLTCTPMCISLLIHDVQDKFAQWNEDHPEMPLRSSDRILEVNGISKDSESMMKQLETCSELHMVLVRPEVRWVPPYDIQDNPFTLPYDLQDH